MRDFISMNDGHHLICFNRIDIYFSERIKKMAGDGFLCDIEHLYQICHYDYQRFMKCKNISYLRLDHL